jgi:hypothetical protein
VQTTTLLLLWRTNTCGKRQSIKKAEGQHLQQPLLGLKHKQQDQEGQHLQQQLLGLKHKQQHQEGQHLQQQLLGPPDLAKGTSSKGFTYHNRISNYSICNVMTDSK